MEKVIFVLNCGSSSLKFALIDPNTKVNVCCGLVENIGTEAARLKYCNNGDTISRNISNRTYKQALQTITQIVQPQCANICAVGHRVVHGGEKFIQSVIINHAVLRAIRKCIPLAPLHNSTNLLGIEHALNFFSDKPQVAVFDTAFHQTMPAYAYVYPVPYSFYRRHKVRRYGFHGISHRFVAQQAALILQKSLMRCSFITVHLGNGCSVAAVRHGKSIDTSMGLTPLEGVMMGTRSGDVDPGLYQYLFDHLGYDVHKITQLLNMQSGLLGVSGLDSDMRVIEEYAAKGHTRAVLALEIFCYRLAKYIASLSVPLRHFDALVFTGGIGENSAVVRKKTLDWLKGFGFMLAEKHNLQHGRDNHGIITRGRGPVAIVVPTHEELLIAEDTWNLVKKK